jgi:dTDP-glucose 4,6-dehydratase
MTAFLVTGGAGFIGANLVHYLLEQRPDAKVIVYDALTYAGNLDNLDGLLDGDDSRCVFVEGDICDSDKLRETFSAHRPTVIYNLAAESHVDRSIDGPAVFVQTNVVGTLEMLEATRNFIASLSPAEASAVRFVHVSTDEVYGSLGAEGFFTETTAYAPNSPYAASKAAADHLVRAYHHTHGLYTVTTNCSNNYGPYQFPEKLTPLVLLNAVEGKPLPVYGDGGNIRDWLHVRDHCSALLAAADRGRAGETYNIGASEEKTTLEMVHAICDALQAERPRGEGSYRDLITFVKDRPGHDQRYAIDSSKIREELGWTPEASFAEALRLTVRWYLENQTWCQRIHDGVYRRERLGLKS